MKIEVPHREHSPETDNLAYSIFSVPLARVPPAHRFMYAPTTGKQDLTVPAHCVQYKEGA